MSEKLALQSEDPLPIHRVLAHQYNKECPSTLGEVVVTDPRDPFVWLAAHLERPTDTPSDKGRQLMWELYRFNVNPIKNPKDRKWRDEISGTYDLVSDISDTDLRCVKAYNDYLNPHVIKEPLPSNEGVTDTSDKPIKLYEPHDVAIVGMIRLTRVLNDQDQEATRQR